MSVPLKRLSSLSIWAFLFALIALAAVLWLHTDANNEIKVENNENAVVEYENMTDEEMIEVCKTACLHDFIMTLPDGYDTFITEMKG